MQVKFYIFSFQMSKIFKKFQPLIEVGITRYLTVAFSPLCAIISPASDMLHIYNNGIGTSAKEVSRFFHSLYMAVCKL